MTIEIDDDVWQDAGKRFDVIRECARQGCNMPDNMENDAADLFYYKWLRRLFDAYKKGGISKEERNHEGTLLRNGYIQYKGIAMLNLKNYKHFHEVRMRTGELYRSLTEQPVKLTQKKASSMLFELVGLLFDDDTRAQKLKEGIENCVFSDRGKKKKPPEIPGELTEWWDAFVEMRAKIKHPLTDRAKQLNYTKLMELSNGDYETANAILKQSVMNSWQGLFALKDADGGTGAGADSSYDLTAFEKKSLNLKYVSHTGSEYEVVEK